VTVIGLEFCRGTNGTGFVLCDCDCTRIVLCELN
jgi:hypothetical protein